MSKTISKDGLYVETLALRDDAVKWGRYSGSLQWAWSLPSTVIKTIPVEKGDEVTVRAVELLTKYYLPYCTQGGAEMYSIKESLERAANDYENTEAEIF